MTVSKFKKCEIKYPFKSRTFKSRTFESRARNILLKSSGKNDGFKVRTQLIIFISSQMMDDKSGNERLNETKIVGRGPGLVKINSTRLRMPAKNINSSARSGVGKKCTPTFD